MSADKRADSDGAPGASAVVQLRGALAVHLDALKTAKRVWVGLSGGADSTALLLSLIDLGCCADLRVSHVNHGAQTEASSWQAHCAALCARLGLGLSVHLAKPSTPADLKDGFEAWARRARYDHWQQLLEPGDLLVLGHHRADQRETIALRLLQGRLPLPMPEGRGLAGAVSGPSAQRAQVLRPFLSATPETCRAALNEWGEAWVEDPSNRSMQFLRNYVRLELLPRLARGADDEVVPWPMAIERCGELTARLVRALRTVVSPTQQLPQAGELLRLPAAALDSPAAVHSSLEAVGCLTRGAAVRDALRRLNDGAQAVVVSSGNAEKALSLWRTDVRSGKQARSEARQAGLLVWRAPTLPRCVFEMPPKGTIEIVLEHGVLRVFGTAGYRFSVRGPMAGDRYPAAGRRRPVREALRAQGVPRWLRPSFPLVMSTAPSAAVPDCLVPQFQPLSSLPNGQDQAREGGRVILSARFEVRVAG